MLLPLTWLREFVPFEGTAQDLGDRLTMLGLELEEIVRPFDGIRDVIVGHVVECGKHPEADKLSVCRVDVGTEVLDIVCGAPNVAKGQKVAVAPVGATLPNGMVIKKAKLRGAPSHGMICSETELGLSEDHSGIMVLAEDATIGAKLTDVLGLETEVLDIGITPNRGDCLSVLGLAREVALAYDLPLSLTPLKFEEIAETASKHVSIEVRDADLCPAYHGRVLDGVSIRKSPDWLRFRVLAMGMRPISNIVDVTNYIMMGYGQPLHAFDLDTVKGGKIIVARAGNGEKFTTLDGQERTLTSKDLTIRDAERAVALAGVMGGLDTEITDTSSRVLIESACFLHTAVRHTARRLGIPSEASYRFERGVNQGLSTFAVDQAAALMAAVGGSDVRIFSGVVSDEPRPFTAPVMRFRPARCSSLLGQHMDEAFCLKTLEKVGCSVDAGNREEWTVTAPSHRPDITREADCIEEVARVYGVDRFEPTLPAIEHSLDRAGRPETEFAFWRRLRAWGRGIGLNEVINYSFAASAELDKLGLPAGQRIAVKNPLSSEMDVLRTDLVPGLLASLRNNLAHGASGLRLFEVAHVFRADPASDTTATEPGRIGFLLYGDVFDTAWPQPQRIAAYEDLKGVVQHFLAFLRVGGVTFTREQDHPWLRPAVAVKRGETLLGYLGRVKPDIADGYHARHDVWAAELDLDLLRRLHDETKVVFKQLPTFPPVRRDITLSVPYDLPAQDVLDAVAAMRVGILEDARLQDVYAPEGKETRNLTYRLTFRHGKRPLEDAEVDKQRDKIAAQLTKDLPVSL